MLDIGEVNREIARLENEDTTYANVEKLAMLYTVRHHQEEPYSYASEPATKYTDNVGASDFIIASSSANISDVLHIIDEHLEAVKVLYPKEYDVIIKKIKGLS